MEHHDLFPGEVLGDILCLQGQDEVSLCKDDDNEVGYGRNVDDGNRTCFTASAGLQQICL